jgi:hypothetical protein
VHAQLLVTREQSGFVLDNILVRLAQAHSPTSLRFQNAIRAPGVYRGSGVGVWRKCL